MKKNISFIGVVTLVLVPLLIRADFKENLQQLRNSAKELVSKIKSKVGDKSPLLETLNLLEKRQLEVAQEIAQKLEEKQDEYAKVYRTLTQAMSELESSVWVDLQTNKTLSQSAQTRMFNDLKKKTSDRMFKIKSTENLSLTELLNAEREIAQGNFIIEQMKKLEATDPKAAKELRAIFPNVEIDLQKARNRLEAENKKRTLNLNELRTLAAEVAATKKRYIREEQAVG